VADLLRSAENLIRPVNHSVPEFLILYVQEKACEPL